MAVDFEQYQKSSEAAKIIMRNEAVNRVRANLDLGPNRATDLPRFFRDIFLLHNLAGINYDLLRRARELAAYPRVRKGFIDVLKAQDQAGASHEVIATIDVGRVFLYHQERPFEAVFDKLVEKHQLLIAEEARRRREAAEAARQQAEARRQARMSWSSRESNAGKSPEWIQAQERIAQLWEQKKQGLPQGLSRETAEADVEYLAAGFDLLKNEILSNANNPLAIRAMLEWLTPAIWRTPRLVGATLKMLSDEQAATPKPTGLSAFSRLAKILFIPSDLHNQTTMANEDQKGHIIKVYRIYSQALHPDVANQTDPSRDLLPHMGKIHSAINSSWNRGRDL